MNYINLKKKRLVGRNNQPIVNQFIIDYSTVEDVSFQIIDDKNQIQELINTEGLYFAGSVGIGKQSYELLFLSKDYKVVDNVITFKVDTYTINYLNYIKKKNTEINIEIGQESLDVKKVILRDFALACPRVYVTGLAPQEIESKNYYTKTEVDELINDVYVPTKVSELENDSGYITGYVETDPVFSATSGQFELKSEAFDGDYNSLTNKPNIPSKTSELTNDTGYITGYVETDPIFSSVSGTLATKTYVNEAIPNISDMINAQELPGGSRILTVGGFNDDSTTKFAETYVIGTNTFIFGSPIFYDGIDYSELLKASSSDFKYKTSYDIERMKRVNATDFKFESYAYFTLTSPITSINYSLPDGTLNNAVLQFTTGDTINYTITGSASYKINKPFNFEPNTSYIIYVDVYDIFWCKLQNFNQ